MPELVGGTRRRGRKSTRFSFAKRTSPIGLGEEGIVRLTEYELLRRNGKGTRKTVLAEKTYTHPVPPRHWFLHPLFQNPMRQYHVAIELMRLNTKHKWELHLPTTVRLIKENGRILPRMVMTPFINLNREALSRRDEERFAGDRERQTKILAKHGYEADGDAFFPIFDLKTERVIALLGDFGGINKIKKRKGGGTMSPVRSYK